MVVASVRPRPEIVAAAERLREELRAAKQGGYYESGWYSYMRRSDIEKLVYLVLGKEK